MLTADGLAATRERRRRNSATTDGEGAKEYNKPGLQPKLDTIDHKSYNTLTNTCIPESTRAKISRKG